MRKSACVIVQLDWCGRTTNHSTRLYNYQLKCSPECAHKTHLITLCEMLSIFKNIKMHTMRTRSDNWIEKRAVVYPCSLSPYSLPIFIILFWWMSLKWAEAEHVSSIMRTFFWRWWRWRVFSLCDCVVIVAQFYLLYSSFLKQIGDGRRKGTQTWVRFYFLREWEPI